MGTSLITIYQPNSHLDSCEGCRATHVEIIAITVESPSSSRHSRYCYKCAAEISSGITNLLGQLMKEWEER